jgi:diguanylate cyclase (GGDEF)-like protein
MEIKSTDNEIAIDIRFRKRPKYIVVPSVLALVALLGIADYLTGFELSFSIFYLIPISITVVLVDFQSAVFISLCSALSWYLADFYSGHTYGHFLITVWNTLMILGYFMLHSFFLNRLLVLYGEMRVGAMTDPLTRAVNTRFFYELFEREAGRARRTASPFTLVYLDLDNFKTMNDTYGHQTGDSILQAIADSIRKKIRGTDVFARMGGDEFAALFPDTDYETSNTMLHRIHEQVTGEMLANNWPVTLSVGAITYYRFDARTHDMINRADELMYGVKRSGKNNIEHISVE